MCEKCFFKNLRTVLAIKKRIARRYFNLRLLQSKPNGFFQNECVVLWPNELNSFQHRRKKWGNKTPILKCFFRLFFLIMEFEFSFYRSWSDPKNNFLLKPITYNTRVERLWLLSIRLTLS